MSTASKLDGKSGMVALHRQIETFTRTLDELTWPVAEDVDLRKLYGEAS